MINVRLATRSIHSCRSLSSNSDAAWRFRAIPTAASCRLFIRCWRRLRVSSATSSAVPELPPRWGCAPAHQQAGGARGHRGGFQSLHRVDPIGANATRSVLILGLGGSGWPSKRRCINACSCMFFRGDLWVPGAAHVRYELAQPRRMYADDHQQSKTGDP
jgi:hypothetical protein